MTPPISFDDWVWNPDTLELRRGPHITTLEPQVAKLFEYLVTHSGELLSHDRIIEVVWNGRVVSDEAVRHAVFILRQALASGGAADYIRTIHKKGYIASFQCCSPTHKEPLEAVSNAAESGVESLDMETTGNSELTVQENLQSSTSVEVHLELLRARQLLATRSVQGAELAIEHLQRALILDPNYAAAYARLADAILIHASSTSGIKAVRPVIKPLLDKALVLDPRLGEAYALRSLLTEDTAVAERDLRWGLELNPNLARAYELLAALQSNTLEGLGLAAKSIDSAITLDPLTPGNFYTKATLKFIEGSWLEVAELCCRVLEMNPDFPSALAQLGGVLAVQGELAEAIDRTRQAVALDPRAVPSRNQLIWLYLAIGDIAKARATNYPPTLSGQLGARWLEGTAQAADMIYSKESKSLAQGLPEIVSTILLMQALADQDYSRALTFLSVDFPLGDSLPANAYGWRLYGYANLLQLLLAVGDDTAASCLQDQIESRMLTVESHFSGDVTLHASVRATMLARAGRGDEACAILESTYLPAPGPRWKLVISNPAFDGIRVLARYQDLVRRIEEKLARERMRCDAMERGYKKID